MSEYILSVGNLSSCFALPIQTWRFALSCPSAVFAVLILNRLGEWKSMWPEFVWGDSVHTYA
jgi:hypothetical protein